MKTYMRKLITVRTTTDVSGTISNIKLLVCVCVGGGGGGGGLELVLQVPNITLSTQHLVTCSVFVVNIP